MHAVLIVTYFGKTDNPYACIVSGCFRIADVSHGFQCVTHRWRMRNTGTYDENPNRNSYNSVNGGGHSHGTGGWRKYFKTCGKCRKMKREYENKYYRLRKLRRENEERFGLDKN